MENDVDVAVARTDNPKKRGAEEPHKGSSPAKRTRTSPTSANDEADGAVAPMPTARPSRIRTARPPARVLSVPAYDRNGNILLAADADDEELSLLQEIPLYAARNFLSRHSYLEMQNRLKEAKKAGQSVAEEPSATHGRAESDHAQSSQTQESHPQPIQTLHEANHLEPQAGSEAGNHNQARLHTSPQTQGQAVTATQVHDEVHAQPETPSRGWAIGSVFGSVRNATSRLLPGFRRTPLTIPDGIRTGTSTVGHTDTPNLTAATANSTASSINSQNLLSTQTEQTENQLTSKLSKASKKAFKSDQRKIAHKKKKEKKMQEEERRKAMLEANKREIDNEVARKVYYALKAEHEAAEAAGKKRKRFSPPAIPNPVGCSYGMDLEFFGADSDDEEEEIQVAGEVPAAVEPEPETDLEPEPSPSVRASKRVRFTADTRFPLEPPLLPQQRNIFRAQVSDYNTSSNLFATAPVVSMETIFQGKETTLQASSTGIHAAVTDDHTPVAPQPTLFTKPSTESKAFTVPEESDSDDSLIEPATISEGKGKGVDWSTRNVGSPEHWKQAPPPPPTPSHASLPEPKITSKEEESLARLRSEALRFTPKQPSTLRSVSRLSTSTVASSDSGDHEETVEAPTQLSIVTREETTQTPTEPSVATREETRQTPAQTDGATRQDTMQTPAKNHVTAPLQTTQTPAKNYFTAPLQETQTPAQNHPAAPQETVQKPALNFFATPQQTTQTPVQSSFAAPPQTMQTQAQSSFAAPQQTTQTSAQNHFAAPQQTTQTPVHSFFAGPQQTNVATRPQAMQTPVQNHFAAPHQTTLTAAPQQTMQTQAQNFPATSQQTTQTSSQNCFVAPHMSMQTQAQPYFGASQQTAQTPAQNLFATPQQTSAQPHFANLQQTTHSPAQTNNVTREAFRQISGNQTSWMSEMEAAQMKYAAEHNQEQTPIDPVVARLVEAIPTDRLLQFEYPTLGAETHHEMDPVVAQLLSQMPDEQLIRFEFPLNN